MKKFTKAASAIIINEVIKQISAGENVAVISKKFGISAATILKYAKKENVVAVHADKKVKKAIKKTDRIDARHISNDERMELRKKAKALRKTTGIAQTARALGVAQLTVRRWEESESDTYHKRGRKLKMLNIRAVTDEARMKLNAKVIEMHKNGETIEAISDSVRVNKLLVARWVNRGVVAGKRGRKAHSTEVVADVATQVEAQG
jgi:DNA-binding transcriptional regulator YiaG